MNERLQNSSRQTESMVDFYGRNFIVSSDVLIPRPETEMMVDAVLNLAGKAYLPGVKPAQPKLARNCRILDVGTGSGCIAITLALELPEATVYGADISEAAMRVARQNAEKRGITDKLKIFTSDLLDNTSNLGAIDIVVANLPYVDKNWEWVDLEALSKEPEVALFAEDGGLALIKKLVQQAKERKIPFLVLEADPCQHRKITEYADKQGYALAETRGFILVFEFKK